MTSQRPAKCPPVSVIICTLNEAQNLPHVLPKIPDWVDEIMLVDGHSTDDTIAVAKTLVPGIKIVTQPGRGKGDALKFGIAQAQGDIIVTLDADGETPPEEINKFIEPLLNGYDFAKGSRLAIRFKTLKHLHRTIGNWIITLTMDLLFFRRYTDVCSGYNAYKKNAIEKIQSWPKDGFENEPFINCCAIKRGLKVIEIEYQDNGRISGDIKEVSWRQGPKAIKTILRERFSA
jgi:glycosyltransferase involved in cell wall biosynthesis